MNDERHKKDAPTSGLLQEALLDISSSVILECEATSSPWRSPWPASALYPSVDPVPPTEVREQGGGTASLQ